MWLLDTVDYHIRYFIGAQVPKYAILSHRWEKQEVSFRKMYDAGMVIEEEEMDEDAAQPSSDSQKANIKKFPLLAEQQRFNCERLYSMRGWVKIVNFCSVAFGRGYKYAWIDTCCIDKSSSAELQEAINSMWKWYRDSSVCIVYMNDVKVHSTVAVDRLDSLTTEEFEASQWFRRGWTLQELIAPVEARLQFFDSSWKLIGDGVSLWSYIQKASGIPMTGSRGSCIAQKMSWAANRTTTREEDMAYCLMGLFRVNMPLLYGEGLRKAFRRLQEEILKLSIDPSILAWDPRPNLKGVHDRRALATSPLCFEARGLTKLVHKQMLQDHKRYMTPMGLQIKTYIRRVGPNEWPLDIQEAVANFGSYETWDPNSDTVLYRSPLACSTTGNITKMLFAYFIGFGSNLYWRIGKCYEDSFDSKQLSDYSFKEIMVMETHFEW